MTFIGRGRGNTEFILAEKGVLAIAELLSIGDGWGILGRLPN